MKWAHEIAEQLISKYPSQETFVCASGISPSGSVHIGNFREVVTTFFVVKALQEKGRKTRFIFSWDDYDRFRKVPANVDPSFEQYIGMPYTEIPDPFGCHSSYAEHFEKQFENEVRQFGIDAEFIYQSDEYKSGRYNDYILHALRHRQEIYDILGQYKTGEASEEERRRFFPISLYCESCKKDNTEVVHFDDIEGTVRYRCTCTNENKLSVKDSFNIKLNWKIDWPMRWMAESVIFEPGGRDHSSLTGSYNVSKDIARSIFNYDAPEYVPYEFIGIKGSNTKMSSSSGHNITPSELLKIYTPEIILYLFEKYRPEVAFNIGLDEDVVRNYSEYERYLKNRGAYCVPSFSQIAGILPLVNFNINLLQEVLNKSGEYYSIDELSPICEKAEYWIKAWNPQKMVTVSDTADQAFLNELTETERGWITKLSQLIQESDEIDDEDFMRSVYAICHDEDQTIKKHNQKRLFKIVYKLVSNSTNGPRLPILIRAVGTRRILNLLEFN